MGSYFSNKIQDDLVINITSLEIKENYLNSVPLETRNRNIKRFDKKLNTQYNILSENKSSNYLISINFQNDDYLNILGFIYNFISHKKQVKHNFTFNFTEFSKKMNELKFTLYEIIKIIENEYSSFRNTDFRLEFFSDNFHILNIKQSYYCFSSSGKPLHNILEGFILDYRNRKARLLNIKYCDFNLLMEFLNPGKKPKQEEIQYIKLPSMYLIEINSTSIISNHPCLNDNDDICLSKSTFSFNGLKNFINLKVLEIPIFAINLLQQSNFGNFGKHDKASMVENIISNSEASEFKSQILSLKKLFKNSDKLLDYLEINSCNNFKLIFHYICFDNDVIISKFMNIIEFKFKKFRYFRNNLKIEFRISKINKKGLQALVVYRKLFDCQNLYPILYATYVKSNLISKLKKNSILMNIFSFVKGNIKWKKKECQSVEFLKWKEYNVYVPEFFNE